MTPTTIAALVPATAWMCAALLCLLLEAAGTPVGFRKRGERTHLPWIIALAGAVVVARAIGSWGVAAVAATSGSGLSFDRPGLLACALIAVVVVAAHFAAVPGLRALDDRRGAVGAAPHDAGGLERTREERGEMSAAFAVFWNDSSSAPRGSAP